MATANAVPTEVLAGQAMLYTWTLTAADTEGMSIAPHEFGDRTVQFAGDFDGANATLQGSNDGTNWVALTDPQGNALTKSAGALETVMETPRYTKVTSSGGGGSQSITISIFCRRTRR